MTDNMTQDEQMQDLAQRAAQFQKGILIIELLTQTLNLPGNCGWNEVNKKMQELNADFDKLGEMVGIKPQYQQHEEELTE